MGSAIFSVMAEDPAKRGLFIQSLLDLATEYGFVGFDIDWEYPGYGSGSDDQIDKADFSALMTEMRTAFDADGSGLVISVALPPGMYETVASTHSNFPPFLYHFYSPRHCGDLL